MKNLKLALSALAIVATVGTALAFKPATLGVRCHYQLNEAGTACPRVADIQSFTPGGGLPMHFVPLLSSDLCGPESLPVEMCIQNISNIVSQ